MNTKINGGLPVKLEIETENIEAQFYIPHYS